MEASLPARQQNRATLVSLLSCKGGAGTSFIAANLAHSLTTLGSKRVLLLDLNTQFADTTFWSATRRLRPRCPMFAHRSTGSTMPSWRPA